MCVVVVVVGEQALLSLEVRAQNNLNEGLLPSPEESRKDQENEER